MDFVAFNIIIDDLVFPDGTTHMGILGGGGPQTAFGMRLWADRVGLVGGVGTDLPATAQDWLNQSGLDLTGLYVSPEHPTPRAWQITEADGRRTQVWRTTGPTQRVQLGHRFEDMPPVYRQAQGFHLGVHPESPNLHFIRSLCERGAILSIEPFRRANAPLPPADLTALVSAGQIFSPNLEEAESLVGTGTPRQLIQRLADAGADIIALRMGSKGAMVHHNHETIHIPAVSTQVIDSTGAGNAFCGGFLVGWAQTQHLRTAGLYGAVAASFLVEQVGLPAEPAPTLRAEAQARLQTLAPLATFIHLATNY